MKRVVSVKLEIIIDDDETKCDLRCPYRDYMFCMAFQSELDGVVTEDGYGSLTRCNACVEAEAKC